MKLNVKVLGTPLELDVNIQNPGDWQAAISFHRIVKGEDRLKELQKLGLTANQIQVAVCMDLEMTNMQISELLNKPLGSVRTTRSNLNNLINKF